GKTADQIAACLNAEGWRTPTRRGAFDGRLIRTFAPRHGLASVPRGKLKPDAEPDEWWLSDLAKALGMPQVTLYGWARRGWLRARRDPRQPRRWLVWADESERTRLKGLRQGKSAPRTS